MVVCARLQEESGARIAIDSSIDPVGEQAWRHEGIADGFAGYRCDCGASDGMVMVMVVVVVMVMVMVANVVDLTSARSPSRVRCRLWRALRRW